MGMFNNTKSAKTWCTGDVTITPSISSGATWEHRPVGIISLFCSLHQAMWRKLHQFQSEQPLVGS